MHPREPGAPSPHLWEEGGAGQDPILEFQVGDPEGGASRSPQFWLRLGGGVETRHVSMHFCAPLPLA